MIVGSMTEEDYRRHEGLSQSELAFMKKSPRHFYMRRELQKETEAMRFGTCFHAALLEPRRFLDSYIVEPSEINGETINKRKKADRAWLENWRADNAGKFILSQKQYDNLVGMATEVGRNAFVKTLIQAGEPEVVSLWQYRGRKCKGKADIWIPETKHGKVLVDIKKTQDASPQGFTRSVYNYSYSLQAAWYKRGFEADKVFIVAVEENFPHAIGVYDMDAWLDHGNALADRLLDRLDESEKTNEWHWYTKDAELLLPPTWLPALKEEEM